MFAQLGTGSQRERKAVSQLPPRWLRGDTALLSDMALEVPQPFPARTHLIYYQRYPAWGERGFQRETTGNLIGRQKR